uniref:Fe2OG dioxygenase domain-containing protein n=1 Tax=Cannabis sativa TaxID=3483 RepID=A0A803PWN8_CANSA
MGSLLKTVQEVALEGGQVPEYFLYKDGHGGSRDVPFIDIPVVDVGLLATSSQELQKLNSALTNFGCFQAINHGMSVEYLNQLREITREFFQLPLEEKKKYLKQENDIEGYGNDNVYSDQQKGDWNDRLFLSLYPEQQRRLKLWPENPKAFRSIVLEYSEKIKSISEIILKAMARPDLIVGSKPHGDASAITFLLQDQSIDGLQILKDNQWFKAPSIPEALLVNVGDQAEFPLSFNKGKHFCYDSMVRLGLAKGRLRLSQNNLVANSNDISLKIWELDDATNDWSLVHDINIRTTWRNRLKYMLDFHPNKPNVVFLLYKSYHLYEYDIVEDNFHKVAEFPSSTPVYNHPLLHPFWPTHIPALRISCSMECPLQQRIPTVDVRRDEAKRARLIQNQ